MVDGCNGVWMQEWQQGNSWWLKNGLKKNNEKQMRKNEMPCVCRRIQQEAEMSIVTALKEKVLGL